MTSIAFICQQCGASFPRWQGRCSECGEWNSLVETVISTKNQKSKIKTQKGLSQLEPLSEISHQALERIKTNINEFDRIMGEGIVPGSVTLIAGEPGIGKSTLVLQLAGNLNKSLKVLYVSGEESSKQVKIRAQRLKIIGENLLLSAETNIDLLNEVIKSEKPDIVIIDSIQTLYSEEIMSSPGSIAQVQNCALRLIAIAKANHLPFIIVGHVTKEGAIAGPKVLEHMVDVVLYLEGERYHDLRILRSVKNRFGGTGELGVFEMKEHGLCEVKNPSEFFLKERVEASGSVVTASLEGARPFLVEIQGLTSKTSFGYPKRTASGIDFNRLNLLVAVLQKRIGLNLFDQDIYINVVGGFKIAEPALDLPICLSITSSFLNKVVKKDLVCFGEVGLSGELRQVTNVGKRIKEVEKMGFKEVLMPAQGLEDKSILTGIKVLKAKTLKEAIQISLR